MILDIDNIHSYYGETHVLFGVSLQVGRGEVVSLLGPNGAGKTTTLRSILGLTPARSGTIIFDDQDVTRMATHEIAKAGISRAFQISNIFHGMTVLENVRAAVHAQTGKALTFFTPADKIGTNETDAMLELCGMIDKRNIVAAELSQGDKKKLELAIALSCKPKLLLLDEPTAGMSLEETRDTMNLVNRLCIDLGLTILFTEHDMSVVFNHSSKVTLLARGEIIIQGTPAEVRADETTKKIYLGDH